MMNESVWVVESAQLFNLLKFEAPFQLFPFPLMEKVFQKCFFKLRDSVESDESIKQIIPYVVFINKANDVFLVKRTKKQSEKRLHEKLSVGIGGHINPSDDAIQPTMTFFNGLNREINEEMHIKNIQRLDYKGVIYDTENSVSRVHLGLLFLAQAESVEIKETENFSGRWISTNDLKNMDISNMETWSQIALKALEKI